ncbi:unnamed protein product [Mytilus edulis]|uniref:ANK_REP_REGION domain-containing protein n=1 Tax=Mytilus edulis TaxID=6550 RepID=A0A8S3QJZ5_MYTED|nr:unnamed protein product [Mytilus edulis]
MGQLFTVTVSGLYTILLKRLLVAIDPKECDILFIRNRIRFHSNENSPEIVVENIVIIKEDELDENHFEPLSNRSGDELSNGRFSSLWRSDLFKNRNFVAPNKPDLTSLVLEYDINQTELHKAVRRDNLESLRSKLLSKDIDCKTKSGWTVLHYAVLLNSLQAVQILFQEELTQNDDSYF